MTSEALFQRDAYLRACEARILECSPQGIVLDRTIFYPMGGGQPGDSGWLRTGDGRSARVLDTRKGEGGRILHVAESPAHGLEVGDAVTFEIKSAEESQVLSAIREN